MSSKRIKFTKALRKWLQDANLQDPNLSAATINSLIENGYTDTDLFMYCNDNDIEGIVNDHKISRLDKLKLKLAIDRHKNKNKQQISSIELDRTHISTTVNSNKTINSSTKYNQISSNNRNNSVKIPVIDLIDSDNDDNNTQRSVPTDRTHIIPMVNSNNTINSSIKYNQIQSNNGNNCVKIPCVKKEGLKDINVGNMVENAIEICDKMVDANEDINKINNGKKKKKTRKTNKKKRTFEESESNVKADGPLNKRRKILNNVKKIDKIKDKLNVLWTFEAEEGLSSDTAKEFEELEEDNIYVVDEILSHKVINKTKNEYKYKVKWYGYDTLTWEPESYLNPYSVTQYWQKKKQ